MNTTLAIIPARSGSKGIPDKNLQLLGGVPLFIRAANIASKVETVRRVVISVDSEEYAAIATAHGYEHHRRPPHLASDKATIDDLARHLLHDYLRSLRSPTAVEVVEAIAAGELYNSYDYLLILQPTVPLIRPSTISEMIEHLMRTGDPSVTAAIPIHHTLWGQTRQRYASGNRQWSHSYFSSEVGVRIYDTFESSDGQPETHYLIDDPAEAFDIDTWQDLELVRHHHNPKCVVVDYSSGSYGTGHKVRAHTILDYLKPQYPDGYVHLYETRHDCQHGVFIADYDQNETALAPYYGVPGWHHFYVEDEFPFDGSGAAIIRPAVRALPQRDPAFDPGPGGRLLVTFGYDIARYTTSFLPELKEFLNHGWEVGITIPGSDLAFNPNDHGLTPVSNNTFISWLATANLVLTNAGNTMLETNYLGVPTVAIPENLKEKGHHAGLYAGLSLDTFTFEDFQTTSEWKPAWRVNPNGLEHMAELVRRELLT